MSEKMEVTLKEISVFGALVSFRRPNWYKHPRSTLLFFSANSINITANVNNLLRNINETLMEHKILQKASQQLCPARLWISKRFVIEI